MEEGTFRDAEPSAEFNAKMRSFPGRSMFDKPVRSAEEFPWLLRLNDSAPSLSAFRLLVRLGGLLHDKDGHYGAGGGRIHIVEMGVSGNPLDTFSVSDLLDKLHVSQPMRPDKVTWVATADPCHQQMFERSSLQQEGADIFGQVMATLADGGSRPLAIQLSPITRREHPCLAHGPPRLLFLMPWVKYWFHDGGCPDGCPRDTSAIFDSMGPAMASADYPNTPCFAVFQMQATGELFALVFWDYHG
eukprot:TRINITY_DN14318_c0_g1_i1.p1 TRINITY_DN14318_c0_g1~~TRINITY_DN14318_c0_g1_i1.p1  ORF type:complete len:245 (+),score=20.72 TRINITY_DN14318_c0_g1_i1:147-881(+)